MFYIISIVLLIVAILAGLGLTLQVDHVIDD